MIERIKNLNSALLGMMLGSILFGVVCEVIVLVFSSQRILYSLSLWVGITISLCMAYHMAMVLNVAVGQGSEFAEKYVRKQNFIRYGVLVLIFALILLTNILNPLLVFLGILGLKVGAYLQPFTDKLMKKN